MVTVIIIIIYTSTGTYIFLNEFICVHVVWFSYRNISTNEEYTPMCAYRILCLVYNMLLLCIFFFLFVFENALHPRKTSRHLTTILLPLLNTWREVRTLPSFYNIILDFFILPIVFEYSVKNVLRVGVTY